MSELGKGKPYSASDRSPGSLRFFPDVAIVPFAELLDNPRGMSFHRGGPIWPDWDDQKEVRHCRSGFPVDRRPADPLATAQMARSREPLVWCGPVTDHFGHQVADFSSRIPAYLSLGRSVFYCFAAHRRSCIRTLSDAPGFFREILEWLGVPAERVRIVHGPVLAERLWCVPQQEQPGNVPPSDDFLDVLDENWYSKGIVPNRRHTYYISRGGMGARFAGEGYLELVLGESGVRVVRPEVISLQEQLRIYSSARRLLFSEGSALHGLQLLGRNVGEVHVLNRRPGTTLARSALAPRCASLAYHDVGDLIYGLNMAGNPCPELGIAVADKRKLTHALGLAGIEIKEWSDELYRRSVDADILKWYGREASSRRASVPGSLVMIRRRMEQLGFAAMESESGNG